MPKATLVDFEINRKTRVLRDKKEVSPKDLATGDSVTVEVRQEYQRLLLAITICGGRPKEVVCKTLAWARLAFVFFEFQLIPGYRVSRGRPAAR